MHWLSFVGCAVCLLIVYGIGFYRGWRQGIQDTILAIQKTQEIQRAIAKAYVVAQNKAAVQ